MDAFDTIADQAAEILTLRARIAELEAERAELVKDRERLDWFVANWYRFEHFTLPDGRVQWAFRENRKGGQADTLRAAIDAAREGE